MTSVLSEYFKLYDEYSRKYGEKVSILMQVGSFYEMYGIDNGVDKLGNAEELSRILNIVLTRRNKKDTYQRYQQSAHARIPVSSAQ